MVKRLLGMWFLLTITTITFSQSRGVDRMKMYEEKRISNFFHENKINEIIPDSNAIYTFVFKVTVEKHRGKTQVSEILSNDTIGYKIFPKYNDLKDIHYAVFMRNRNKAIFIFPVAIEIVGSKQANTLTKFATHSIASLFYTYFNKTGINMLDYMFFSPYLVLIDKRVYD